MLIAGARSRRRRQVRHRYRHREGGQEGGVRRGVQRRHDQDLDPGTAIGLAGRSRRRNTLDN